MQDSNPVATPTDLSQKLIKIEKVDDEVKSFPYRELVGSLMYLATTTRPDIAYIAGALSRFHTCYTRERCIAAKRVLRYLKDTIDLGIRKMMVF